MRKLDREIIEIGQCASFIAVVDRMQSFRESLPPNSDARVEIQGDENFGWRLAVTYSRELTAEEAEIQRRYAA